MKIKEVVVVEGKDDISSVKRAVDCEVIATNGYGYNKDFIKKLSQIEKNVGLIIFTDPDYMGEKIRRDLTRQLKNPKQAFLAQEKGLKDGDIGIENASGQDIREALERAKPQLVEKRQVFSQQDLLDHGLLGGPDARRRREELGQLLSIGYSNGKQLVSRLNSFGISRQDFEKALERIDHE